MYDIVIVGAGPSGMTAAIYARRANKKVLVLEASLYGGQILNTLHIENYPALPHVSGYLFATNLYQQMVDLGAEVKFEKALQIENLKRCKKIVTSQGVYRAKALILATGADYRTLGLSNEEEFVGRGVSYCATCDGAFYKKKDVAVVGGGNTALEDALYLAEVCHKVYLIHRRDEFRGDISLSDKIKKKKNIEILYDSCVSKIEGEEKLERILVTNKKTNDIITLLVSGLFIAVGRVPENQNFARLIHLDSKGYIIASEDCHTNVDGIFACGDNRVKSLRQLVTAVSDGGVAATEAVKYIQRLKK